MRARAGEHLFRLHASARGQRHAAVADDDERGAEARYVSAHARADAAVFALGFSFDMATAERARVSTGDCDDARDSFGFALDASARAVRRACAFAARAAAFAG